MKDHFNSIVEKLRDAGYEADPVSGGRHFVKMGDKEMKHIFVADNVVAEWLTDRPWTKILESVKRSSPADFENTFKPEV